MKEYLLKSDVLNEMEAKAKWCEEFGYEDIDVWMREEAENLANLDTYQLRDEQLAPYGQWLPNYGRDAPTYDGGLMIRYFHCSVCKGDISDRYGLYRYCPHCGAKMED